MERVVKCEMKPGLFSGEWAVRMPSIEGTLSLTVDEHFVHPEREPENGEAVPGGLKVRVVPDENDEALLVQLPVDSSFAFTRVRVPRDLFIG